MRSHDPLNPNYQLSKVEIRPPTPPKFIRDNIHHDDIDGSKPKKPTYYETRGTILVSSKVYLLSERNIYLSNLGSWRHRRLKAKR
jgi:hypothetical protein